ncbi:MAG: DUF6282 family protein [Thermodesulfobacteriota bacterium]
MPLVDLSGAFDLHVHSSPEMFPRLGDDLDLARHAAVSGLGGILLKNHFESTVGRAHLAQRGITEGSAAKVFGGLVLNHGIGGLNPLAVETSLHLGARQVWMPTVDAAAHGQAHGRLGGYGYQESNLKAPRPGLTVLDESGRLKAEVETIVTLIREAGAILGTAHLDRAEIFALAEFARKIGFSKLLITHPEFNPPRLSLTDQKILVELGATLELCGGNLYPIPGLGRLDDFRRIVADAGAEHVILTSDAGQPRKSWPAEVLRVFAQNLMEKGVTQAEIDLMTKVNPARLLGL